MKNYKFTIIAAAVNGEHFAKTADSIIEATANLADTQLILCDTVCSDRTTDVTKKLSTYENVTLVECKGLCEADAFNKALPLISGEYTVFAEEGVIYSKEAFDAMKENCETHPHIHLTMSATALTKDKKKLKYAHFPIKGQGVINLEEQYCYGHTALSAYAFVTKDIDGIEFDSSIFDESRKKFVLEALCKKPVVYLVGKHACFYTNALENDTDLNPFQFNKWYYTPSLENFIIPFMEELREKQGKVPRFVQFALSQLILAKYANNYYENDKGVLSEKEAYEFYHVTCKALGYIDNAIFTDAAIKCKYVPRSMWAQLLFGKLEKAGTPHSLTLESENDSPKAEKNKTVYLRAEGNTDARITTLKSVAVIINSINYGDGMLEFDAEFTGKDFMKSEEVELFVEYAGKKVKLEEYPVYPLLKCFGLPYAKKYNVHFFVPVSEDLKNIKFCYNLCGTYQTLPLKFAGQFSRLRMRFGKSYWKFTPKLAMEVQKGNTLNIFECTGLRHLKREISLYLSMLKNSQDRTLALKCVGLRVIYHLTRPFYKNRRIILTFDKLYKAGDNGEYFWKYANSVDDGVETYYVVSDTSLDYKRLKNYDKKHTVVHNSLRCKLLALNMEAIAATHTLVMQFCGFSKDLHAYFLDLWNPKVICIQHGLTVQQLAQYQRRTYDNTTLYCLASKYEKQNLMHPIYGYEESMLKLNGLARYDGLKNNDKKFILITPTWRRNIVAQGSAFKKKPYNELFKTTEYFRLYNELIHDKKLIETAKTHGYEITYLLHPAMSPQLEDFDQTGYVKVIAASGDMNYEEILTQASLMVTDYSGVQFDFAYMRKPIVYYHPSTLPPHYETGGLDYTTQGFGPICTEHKELVDTVCKFIENSCEALEEYKQRADDFFEFDDFNNCRRIYDEILNSLNKN